MRPPRLALTAAAVCAAVAPGCAQASQLITRNASHVTLRVNARGQALLSYRARGRVRHVLAWGAVNATAPAAGRAQVRFRLDYSGGWGTYHRAVWRAFPNECSPYHPPLHWLVTACTAPDGSHWAVQAWQRMLPDYGGRRAPWELHLSHWTGTLPRLRIGVDYSYRRFHHLYGSVSFHGAPVYGFRATSRGSPLDGFGRNLYVDTHDSAYGRGWRRENSFLVHAPAGTFCYGFYPHGRHPSGMGDRYRATIVGPGVAPDAFWTARAPTVYDPAWEHAARKLQSALFARDHRCHPL